MSQHEKGNIMHGFIKKPAIVIFIILKVNVIFLSLHCPVRLTKKLEERREQKKIGEEEVMRQALKTNPYFSWDFTHHSPTLADGKTCALGSALSLAHGPYHFMYYVK